MLSSTGTLSQLNFFSPCASSIATSFSFYGGDLIFRGRFNATGEVTAIIWGKRQALETSSTNGVKEPRGIRGYALVGGNSIFSSWTL
ncbi:hypothetical protein BT96DRAFT_1005528 [Gymnopus androsaceus JB14]|uniref:Uncharacterized protein n=1 Tax=Gymnopus androsaceus JB14 TaxID=1447944 RepID=A0A6A4GP63_9AGAR|nr:hypothetical protein BT96DRAFT_1005528 [Gymnopus androsaceus JB14]